LNTVAFVGLVTVVCACSDSGTGPSEETPMPFLFESLTVGIRHSCGLAPDGKAYCWGSNEYGRLGDGSTSNRSTPVPVAGDLTFSTLVAGGRHTCGLTMDASAYCWGGNHVGQLGDGTTTDRMMPGKVAGGLEFVSLSLGGGYSCGLTAAGDAYCWGGNLLGNFGNGKEVVGGACELTASSRPPEVIRPYCTSPVPAAIGLTLRRLEPGSWHACGSALGGTVYCWGSNAAGQVGDNTTTDRLTPAPVASEQHYVDLSGGSTYACALRVDGEADCWGHLPYTYLNDNIPAPGSVIFGPTLPEPMAPGLKFKIVSVGAEVACGLTDDDSTAQCWGDGLHGALGDGTMRDPNNPNSRPRMTPAPVLGGRTFQTIVVGNRTACGLTAEGAAYCWGRNDYGQLGDGTTVDRPEPVVVRAS
jgi:alpha-tubulin suppressor-like RCC1 family protein